MRLALIADAFPPMRSSGAVQLRDLSREFARQGHQVTVLVPAPGQDRRWLIEDMGGVEVVRLTAPQTRGASYVRRTIAEFLLPFVMMRNLRASPAKSREFDGIIWYSPTIFLGPIVKRLRRRNRCPSYLIIRDIFPDWAVDLGLMGRGWPYRFFKAVANFQYSVADIIGVQTRGNLAFFEKWRRRGTVRLEILQNWLGDVSDKGCSIDLAGTSLAGRRIFVYTGNMGVAQGMPKLLDLAARLKDNRSLGFVFVGRGSEISRLRDQAQRLGLRNTLIYDEIEPEEMAGLLAQCSAGLLALDSRHTTHNVPGKFISYMHAGLPVLASINAGNDLERLVVEEGIGRVSTDPLGTDLADLALSMLKNELQNQHVAERCRDLAKRMFSASGAARQIATALAQ
jgi:glycosyltransferase involved in cell wall biosynthesis